MQLQGRTAGSWTHPPGAVTIRAMARFPVLKLLLSPSLLSGTLAVLFSAVVCLVGAWSYISTNGLFYDALFGANGLASVVVQAPDRFSWLRHTLGSPIAYYLLVMIAGVITSIAVYAGLQAVDTLRDDFSEMHRGTPRSGSFRRELLSRLWIKLLGTVAWGCYTLFFIGLVMPAALVLLRNGIDQLQQHSAAGLALMPAAFIVLIITAHVHTVFIRILLLRYRVFEGADLVTEEKMRTE
jgi:hypothetical protein